MQNKNDGHTVKIIASTETFIDNCKLGYLSPGSYTTETGIPIKRLPYRRIISHYLSSKLRSYWGLMSELEAFKPDVILYHGCGGLALLELVRYKKNNPQVKLFMDSHADQNNSARNPVSKNIQHKLIHAPLTRYAYPYLDRVLYISEETKSFLTDLYKVPTEKLEFFPLGGIVVDGEDRLKRRNRVRTMLGLHEDDILLCHTGKMDKLKRTEDLLCALSDVKADNLRLILIGSLPEDTKDRVLNLVEKDARVSYLGWKSADELLDYLCACDLYLQPGSQSATLIGAICCGAPVMIYPHKSFLPNIKGNVWYVDTVADMGKVLSEVVENPRILKEKSKESFALAYNLFDYRKLASRIYE